MADRQRQNFRANFRGVNTREPPDAMPPGKWVLGQNVRADGDAKIRTRPGYEGIGFTGAGAVITDIGSYAALETDSAPRVLLHAATGAVYLVPDPVLPSQGTPIGQVGVPGQSYTGATILPFRPNASPEAWAYVANASGYRKFSTPHAPDSQGNVTHDYKVGLAEPQVPPDACVEGVIFHEFTGTATDWFGFNDVGKSPSPTPPNWHGFPNYTQTQTRSTDTGIGLPIMDPASPATALKRRYSVPHGLIDQTTSDLGNDSPGNKTVNYQVGQTVQFGSVASAVVEDVFPAISATSLVIEGIQTVSTDAAGTHVVIVPSVLPLGQLIVMPDQSIGQPSTGALPGSSFIGTPQALADLRRGSLITLGYAASPSTTPETVFVESVTVGPDGQIAIDTTVNSIHGQNDPIAGVPAIGVSFDAAISPGSIAGVTATVPQINFLADAPNNSGLAWIQQRWTPQNNPFSMRLVGGVPQESDLIHVSISAVTPVGAGPNPIQEARIVFDVDDGTFLRNTLYFSVSEAIQATAAAQAKGTQFGVTSQLATNSYVYQQVYASLTRAGYNAQAILGSSLSSIAMDTSTGAVSIYAPDGRVIQLNVPFEAGDGVYTEVTVTIQSLQRTGADDTKTLANCTGVAIMFNVTAETAVGVTSLYVAGGGQPDVGDAGAPYYYRVVPYSTITGISGNPSPATRYGVTPRSQQVHVGLGPGLFDSLHFDLDQTDTWDIYRYGGAVPTWRWIGSTPVFQNNQTVSEFIDNYFDSAARGGNLMETDNYQPWPTVDVPWNSRAVGVTEVDVVGTTVTIYGSDFSFPASIPRWLPGTEIVIGGAHAYVLWNRPVQVPGKGIAPLGWMLRLLTSAGVATDPLVQVQEPLVANQILPYVWGPDKEGIVYGAGDPLRPGTFQPAKANNPDAVPNNAVDLTPSSEPLLGGQIVDGVSVLASSDRWWMLQTAMGSAGQFNPVEMPFGRGVVSPWGHATDGRLIFFWAKDGIYAGSVGGTAKPLTQGDLGNLFPQGGATIGQDIFYGGTPDGVDQTYIYAPDYTYAASFRLSVVNAILRAHYRDRTGTPRTLVCDMTEDTQGQPRMAWSVDVYANPVTVSFQPPQPASTLGSASTRYGECYLGAADGTAWLESDLHNDNATPISCVLATPEFDAGDSRVQKHWLESMIDMVSLSSGAQTTVTPTSNGIEAGNGENIPATATRVQHLVPLSSLVSNAMGLLFRWTDDFSLSLVPTTLYEWSEEFVAQPLQIGNWISNWTNFKECGLDGYLFIYRLRLAYTGGPATLHIGAYDGIAPQPITIPATAPGEYRKTEFVPTPNKALLFQFTATGDWAPDLTNSEIIVCQWGRTGMCARCNGLGGAAN